VIFSLIALIKAVLLIIAREVTLRKQAEARTHELAQREAQRRMNEFITIASHELKTPLTSIKGNIQLMGRRLKYGLEAVSAISPSSPVQNPQMGEPVTGINDVGGSTTVMLNATSMSMGSAGATNQLLIETKELLDRTDKQVSHLTRMVNALLESSRLNNNAPELRLDRYEMNKLVREVVQETPYVPAKRTLHIESAGEDLVVLADIQRIKQVVVHFISNAHKFSPIEEQIDVVVRREDDKVHVSVHDSGPGIPAGEHNKVWERFYRVPAIEVRNGSEIGLGLGLYLSRLAIEQHHGTVGLKSAPGDGSTFWFSLPLADND
jgi:signal transduction histidine kinase